MELTPEQLEQFKRTGSAAEAAGKAFRRVLAGNHWISVKDRLPGLWERVLVFVHATNHQDVHFGWIKDTRTGEWEVLDEKGNHTAFLTHWMPLPEPPKP